MRLNPLGDAGALGATLHDAPGADPREWLAPRVQQQPALRLSPIQRWTKRVEIGRNGADHASADGHQALLASLAKDTNQPLAQEQVAEAQFAKLRHPQTDTIGKLEQRAVPPGHGFVYRRRGQKALDFPDREHLREVPPSLGTLQPVARIVGDPALPEQESEISANCGDLPADSRGAQAEVLEQEDEIAEQRPGNLRRLRCALGGGEFRQPAYVTSIRLDCVRAVSRLECEVVAERLYLEDPVDAFEHRGHRAGCSAPARDRRRTSATSAGLRPKRSPARCMRRSSCASMAPSLNAACHMLSIRASR